MSYFAQVKCPHCGKEKQMHLGGYGFFGVGKTHCDYCGYDYDAQENCKEMEVDRDCMSPHDYDEPKSRNSEVESLRAENKWLREEIERLKKGRGV